MNRLPESVLGILLITNCAAAQHPDGETVVRVTATTAQTSIVVEYPAGGASAGFFRVQLK